MLKHSSIAMLSAGVAALSGLSQAARADAYLPPVCDGGWTYVYNGDQALVAVDTNRDRDGSLDGNWGWYCGSTLQSGARTWDGIVESGGVPGTAPGVGAPGGIAILTDPDSTTYLRMQDPGDPRPYGVLQPTNQKFMFGHNISSDVGPDVARSILDHGVTLSFRIRLPTPATANGGLDNRYPPSPVGVVPWPEGGDGYMDGVIAIRQDLGDQLISFGYALATDLADNSVDVMQGRQGLTFNRLHQPFPNSGVEPNETNLTNGTFNVVQVADMTVWHEFWITIRKGGAGTHQVTVWMDGSLTPVGTYDVTAFTENSLSMGLGFSNASGAVDVDFVKYAAGAYPPSASACLLTAGPASTQTVTAARGQPVDPIVFTLANCDGNVTELTYTVEELDAGLNPTNVSWLSLDKTGGSVAIGGTDRLEATLDTNQDPGTHTAYVRITDACSPGNVILRRIDMTVLPWNVSGCVDDYRSYLREYPALPPAVPYTITNGTGADLSYTVTVDVPWVTFDPASGTIPAGGAAATTGTFNLGLLAGLGTGTNTANITFTNTADSSTIGRKIRLEVVGVGSPLPNVAIWTYRGDVDLNLAPDHSAGADLKFRVLAGTIEGAVETDPDARNKKVWRLIDDSDTDRVMYEARRGSGAGENVNTIGGVGVTVVSRFKVNSWSGPALSPQLYIFSTDAYGTGNNQNAALTSLGYWGGADGTVGELLRNAIARAAGSDGFVTVRMTSIGRNTADAACNRTVRIYLNEDPTPVLVSHQTQYTAGSPLYFPREGFGFGVGSQTGMMDVSFDWVSGTNGGAFAPGEEVAVFGRSLIPEFCPTPFADFDGDGDVDQVDFGEFQRCFTGFGGATSPECACFDQDGINGVDDADLTAFVNCASGPNIQADPGCQP
ncbi:MAG: hypothetical protein AMXMBFR83_23940 [Phycisphaerae bacterium]